MGRVVKRSVRCGFYFNEVYNLVGLINSSECFTVLSLIRLSDPLREIK